MTDLLPGDWQTRALRLLRKLRSGDGGRMMNLGAAIDYARQFAYDAPAMHRDYEQTADAFAALLDALAGYDDTPIERRR